MLSVGTLLEGNIPDFAIEHLRAPPFPRMDVRVAGNELYEIWRVYRQSSALPILFQISDIMLSLETRAPQREN